MISVRQSPEAKGNRQLQHEPPQPGETNSQWLARLKQREGVLLIGGSALAHFRIRVAQSHLRKDLLPSFWSLAGILDGDRFSTAPLDGLGDASLVPLNNGVQTCRVADYSEPERYPNIAVLHFAKDPAALRENIKRVQSDRSIIDLPALILEWLGFVWGAGQRGNPLLQGHGLPGAALVEAVHGLSRIELTPGLSSASSCPEAIWQSAKWWRSYYQETAGATAPTHAGAVPSGYYAIRQEAAAAVEHERKKRRVKS